MSSASKNAEIEKHAANRLAANANRLAANANRLTANTDVMAKQQRAHEAAMEVALSIINTHMRNGTVPQASPETFRFLKQMAEPARLRYIRRYPERILRNTLRSSLLYQYQSSNPPAHAPLFARIDNRILHVSSSDRGFYRQYKLTPFHLTDTNWKPLGTTTTNFTNNRIRNALSDALPRNSITKMLLNQSHFIPRLSKRNIESLVRRVQPISNNPRNNKVVFAIGTPSSRRREFLEFARNLMDHLGTAQLTPNALANKSKWLLGSPILDQRTEYALERAKERASGPTGPEVPRPVVRPVPRKAPVAVARPVLRTRSAPAYRVLPARAP